MRSKTPTSRNPLTPALLLGLALSAPAAAPAAEENLYRALGGQSGLAAVTDAFLWRLADDDRINHFFVETNLNRFREKLLEYFCQTADGPCEYSGDTMERTHANLHITIADFNAVVEDLIQAMEEQDIPTGTQNRFLKRLATQFDSIVRVPPADTQHGE